MRWLFLFVLILNFAYVGWELSRPEVVPQTPVISRDVPKIVLLSEIGKESAALPVDESVTLSDQAEGEAVAAKAGCFTMGPFRDLEKLRAVTRGIKKYVVDASFRSHEEREQEMFWVYLEPSKDYDEARRLADRLKKAKVNDYFIVKSGAKANGISLGHFREKNRAYAHAEHIRALGFKPEVEVLFKEYTIYWLDYAVSAGSSIPEDVLKKHLTGKINHLVRDCS